MSDKEFFRSSERKEKIQVKITNAFTRDGKGGNEAGVVINANGLTGEEKLFIAKQVGLSETAFVQDSSGATRKVDFYTPERRVPLCGHATIATWGTLHQLGIVESGEHTQELQEGVFKVTVFDDGKVVMDQPLPQFGNTFSDEELANLLGIPEEWIKKTGLKPQLVNTGLNDLLIPILDREKLFSIKFDDKMIKTFQKKHDLVSLHPFTFDTLDSQSTTNSRNTDPLDDIHEESATGSAHGALTCYLFQNKKVTEEDVNEGLIFEQGDSMGQPSRIDTMLSIKDGEITRVRVGGYSTILR